MVLGLSTVALTGAGELGAVAELCVRVPSDDTPRVQEMCMLLGHTLCEIVERDSPAPTLGRFRHPPSGGGCPGRSGLTKTAHVRLGPR